MHLLKHSALFLLLLTITVAAQAKDVVILADLDRGLAFVPDGTDYPNITVRGRNGQPLVFTHAAESQFTAARAAIAATPRDKISEQTFIAYEGPVPQGRRLQSERFRAATDDTDVTYYTYFYDGSWISARKAIITFVGGINYQVNMSGFAADNDYYDGWIYLEMSSTDHPGYNYSKTCSIGSTGGSCYTPAYAYSADASFTAHVSCYGNIHQHRLPICGRYGEPPCQENLSTTIDIYFP
jgi:hypothetical protein